MPAQVVTDMPSDDGIIVPGIDLDGVCADFYARMREIAVERFEGRHQGDDNATLETGREQTRIGTSNWTAS
jgi:hypothetical protein